jgi:hypothetical protein
MLILILRVSLVINVKQRFIKISNFISSEISFTNNPEKNGYFN